MPCERCGERFTESKLKKHKERKRMCHPRSEQNTFKIPSPPAEIPKVQQMRNGINCDICDEEVGSLTSLKYHIQKAHRQDIVCQGCSKTFGCDKDLIFHKKRKKDCPAYDPDLQYVPVTKNLSAVMKNEAVDTKMNLEMLKQANLETRVFKSESLQEHVDPMEVREEHINCWGCHKVSQNLPNA